MNELALIMADLLLLLLLLLFVLLPAKITLARPQGAHVIHGEVQIRQQGLNTTLIEASENSIIDYQSFNIASHETVQFLQPHTASRVFNRVSGSGPSLIDGNLLANGQVYIVNESGVFFGQTAVIDVAGLYSAAGSLSNADFLSGKDHFTDLSGQVINEGFIRADAVHLFGKHVLNIGSIVAPEGTVVLGSGEEVFLGSHTSSILTKISGNTFSDDRQVGVENQGNILSPGGTVFLGAADIYSVALRSTGSIQAEEVHIEGMGQSLVEIQGTIDVNQEGGKGGRVSITGERVGLYSSRIQAYGGEVFIGGNHKGQGPLRNASATFVDDESRIDVSAQDKGDGGTAILWADDWTRFEGRIEAHGGERGGDGGFVEVSGYNSLFFNGEVYLQAEHGTRGTLLLDPSNITILDSNPQVDDGDLPDLSDAIVGAGNFQISEEALESLASNANLILEATNDITINDLSDDLLDLALDDSGSVTITADSDSDGLGSFTMNAGDTLQTAGASLTLSAETITSGSLDTSPAGGVNRNVTLTAGDSISIQQVDADSVSMTAANGITLNADLSSDGNTVLNADSDANGTGTLASSSNITTSDNNLTMTAGDYNLTGSIDSGNATTTFQVTNNANISFGDDNGGVHLSQSLINSVTANQLLVSTGGAVTVDNIAQSDTDGVGNRITVTSTAAGVFFSNNASTFDGAFTANGATGISISQNFTSNGGTNFTSSGGTLDIDNTITTNNGNLTLQASGLDLDAAVSSGNGDTSIVANANVDISLTGSAAESNPFDLDNTTLSRITSDRLNFNASGSGTIDVSGLSHAALINVGGAVSFTSTNGDISFSTAASSINSDLNVTTNANLSIAVDVTTNGVTTLTVDNDNNGSGNVQVSADVQSGGNLIDITAADMSLTGSLDSGASLTRINASANRSIGLGGASQGLDLSNAELTQITSTGITFDTDGGGDIHLDGVTAASTSNISGTITLDASDDVLFENAASQVTNSLVTNPGGDNRIFVDVTSTSGALTFQNSSLLEGDVTIQEMSGSGISFLGTVDSDSVGSPRSLTIQTSPSGASTFNGAIGGVAALSLFETSANGNTNLGGGAVHTTSTQNYQGALILNADTVMSGSTFDFLSTVDSDATQRDLSITSTDTVNFSGNVGVSSNALDVFTVTTAGSMDIPVDITATSTNLHSGSDGTGNLTFGTGVDIQSTDMTLRAGDGTGGSTLATVDAISNSPSFRSFSGGSTSPTNFTIRTDAQILDSGMPATSQLGGGSSGVNIFLDSDDSNVEIRGNADRFAGSNLDLTGQTGVVSTSVPLSLNSLNVTGAASLEQNLTAATTMTFNHAVVLNADITLNSPTLSFLGTVDSDGTPRFLDIDSSILTTFSSDVGVSSRLAGIDTDAGGTTAVNGSSFLTTGSIDFRDTLTLGSAGSQQVDASSGSLMISSSVTKASGDLTVGGSSGIDLNGGISLSSGSLTIDDDFIVSGDLIASNNVTLSGAGVLDAVGSQRIDAQGGTLLVSQSLGKTFSDLVLAGASSIDLNAPVTSSVGSLTVEDSFFSSSNLNAANDLYLQGSGTLDGSGNQTLNAGSGTLQALSITKTGAGNASLSGDTLLDLNGDIDIQLGSLTLDDPASIFGDISAQGITLVDVVTLDGGNQSFDAGTVSLQALGSLTKTTGGDLALGGDTLVDLRDSLSVQSGSLTVSDSLQASSNLTSVGMNLQGATLLNGVGDQTLDAGTSSLVSQGSLSKTSSGDLSLKGDGLVDINADVSVQSGSLTIEDPYTVFGDLIASEDVTLSSGGTLDGSSSQRIDAQGGDLTIIGALTKTVGDLILAGESSMNLDAVVQAVGGSLSIEDNVILQANLLASGSLNILGSLTLDGNSDQSLEATGGTLSLFGDVLKETVGSLSFIADAIAINTDEVNTGSENQIYDGPLTLGSDVTFTSGDLDFKGSFDGPYSIILEASGDTVFHQDIGSLTPLGAGSGDSITINSVGGSVFIGNITTVGGITQAETAGTVTLNGNVNITGENASSNFQGDVVIGGVIATADGPIIFGSTPSDTLTLMTSNTVIDTSDKNRDVIFNSKVEGTRNFTVNTGSGSLRFNASVGTGGVLENFTVLAQEVDIYDKIEASQSISITSAQEIRVNGFIDPTTITLTAGGDILINSDLLASDTITIRAGTSGTGAITRSTGTITANAINLEAATGLGTLSSPIFLAGSQVSAMSTSGGIFLQNSNASATTVSQLTANSGDIFFSNQGGGAVTFHDVVSHMGGITLQNTSGNLLLSPNLSLGSVDSKGSGDILLQTMGSGDIYIGYLESLNHRTSVVSAGDIQDAQDDRILDIRSLNLLLDAEGRIGGSSLVGNFLDLEGNVEIFSPGIAFTSEQEVYRIDDQTPLYLRVAQDTSLLSYHSRPLERMYMSQKKISSQSFLIGKTLYSSLDKSFVELAPYDPLLEVLNTADHLLYTQDLTASPLLEIKDLKDIFRLKSAWAAIKRGLDQEMKWYQGKGESIFVHLSHAKTQHYVEGLRLLREKVFSLNLSKEHRKFFDEELASLVKPRSMSSSQWSRFLDEMTVSKE